MGNEIVEVRKGDNTEIITLNGSFLIPEFVVASITSMTNDREEAVELLAYLRERVDSFNDSLEFENIDDDKFKFTPSFIVKLCSILMCEGFIPEQIINVLDGMKDFEIFGSKSLSFISTEDDRIKYILEIVKTSLDYNKTTKTEENSYSNVDELIYRGV